MKPQPISMTIYLNNEKEYSEIEKLFDFLSEKTKKNDNETLLEALKFYANSQE